MLKKFSLIIIISSIFLIKRADALVFDLTRDETHKFQVTWLRENTNKTMNVIMYKITDKDGNVYYNVDPETVLFAGRDYEKSDLNIDLNLYKKIANIIYYGYGYQDFISDKYYFATQYLIFKALGVDIVKVVDKNTEEERPLILKQEIEDIESVLKEKEEKVFEYKTKTDSIEIDDPYLIDNFDFISDDILINKTNDKYTLSLLNDKNEYEIILQSKNNCLPSNYWSTLAGPDLLGKTAICEENKIMKIKREKEEISDKNEPPEKKPPLDNNEEKIENIIIEDTKEIEMPETSAYDIKWLIMLILLGNLYYVYKK